MDESDKTRRIVARESLQRNIQAPARVMGGRSCSRFSSTRSAGVTAVASSRRTGARRGGQGAAEVEARRAGAGSDELSGYASGGRAPLVKPVRSLPSPAPSPADGRRGAAAAAPRPASRVISDLEGEVERIVVSDRTASVFSVIHLTVRGERVAIDARASDAVALALRARSPILIDEHALDPADLGKHKMSCRPADIGLGRDSGRRPR